MMSYVLRTCGAAVMVGFLSGTAIADSAAEREGLAAIARDLDILSEAVRRLEERSSGTSADGSRYRFDNLRIRITELEDSIRFYLEEVESEPRRTLRVDVRSGTSEVLPGK